MKNEKLNDHILRQIGTVIPKCTPIWDYDQVYSLKELIEILEDIRNTGDGYINHPKAYYCLCLEIQKIKDWIEYHDL